jgi:hypothetical protein
MTWALLGLVGLVARVPKKAPQRELEDAPPSVQASVPEPTPTV